MPGIKPKTQSSKLKTFEFGKKNSVWNLVFKVWLLKAGFTLRSASLSRSDIKVHRYGFTLIEFIVVLGILGFIVTSTVLFLNSVLRGANQTNITQEVKQNGQVILDSLDKEIRGSIDVSGIGVGPDYTTIELIRPNGNPLYIKCLGATATQNDRIGTAVSASGPPASDSGYTSISNDNRVSGVEVTGCKFNIVTASVSQGATVPAVVVVSFTVSQGLDAPYRQDFAASAPFVTTISLRAY